MKRESEKSWRESKKFLLAFACLLILLLIYVDAMHHVDTYRVGVVMPLLLEIAKIMEVSILSCLGVYGLAQTVEKINEGSLFRGSSVIGKLVGRSTPLRLDPKDFESSHCP